MASPWKRRIWIACVDWPTPIAVALAVMFVLVVATPQATQAQTFTVIHDFTGGSDGGSPSWLAADGAGNLYGVEYGSGNDCGQVYKLTHKGSNWLFSTLYKFQPLGSGDGCNPTWITVGPDGALYGTTEDGGAKYNQCGGYTGCGTVFRLSPPASFCRSVSCPWTETLIHLFGSSGDGWFPTGVTFCGVGLSMFGTTGSGTSYDGWGTIWHLGWSGGQWQEGVLHSFAPYEPGGYPSTAVITDESCNLYYAPGYIPYQGNTGVFEFAGGVITLNPFLDESHPGPVIFDQYGNLVGGAYNVQQESSYVFQLIPTQQGYWSLNVIYDFGRSPAAPTGGLAINLTSGTLYGQSANGGNYGYGTVFKLTFSNGKWAYTDLHDFNYWVDGASPGLYGGSPILAPILYGTTSSGGKYGKGVVYEMCNDNCVGPP